MNAYANYRRLLANVRHVDAVDLLSDQVRVALLEGYEYDHADKYLIDVVTGGGTIIGRSAPLTSPNILGSTFDADDALVSDVPTGHTICGYVLFKETGDDKTSTLICYVDEDPLGAPIALRTNGSSVRVSFHTAGILDLS